MLWTEAILAGLTQFFWRTRTEIRINNRDELNFFDKNLRVFTQHSKSARIMPKHEKLLMFSHMAAAHLSAPRNVGRPTGATHVGTGGTQGEGPYIRLWLKIEGEVVVAAGYECNGCPSSQVAASVVAQLAIGRERSRLQLLNRCDLILVIGGLPEGKDYYANLAVDALSEALRTEVNKSCN